MNSTQSGEIYPISFTVTNIGNGTSLGVWYDTVYLSEDPLIDPFDKKLKTQIRPYAPLSPSGSYNQTLDLFIPFDLAHSSYYIIVKSNVDETVFEEDMQNNVDAVIVKVMSAPAVDIVTTDVTHSETETTYHDPITYEWNIQNNGSLPFRGYKCDTVYLSPDDSWNIEDVVVSGPTCSAISLEANTGANTDAYAASAPIPQVAEGHYKTMVRSRTNARDANLENNIGTSLTDINITPPAIAMGETKTMTLTGRGSIVLKVTNVPSGVTLLVTLVTTYAKAYHQMYLKVAQPPKPYDYDAIGLEMQIQEQQVYVSYTTGPAYYLLVESLSHSIEQYQVEIEAKEATFELNTIYPVKVSSFERSTIRLNGMLFGWNLKVCVYLASQPTNQHCAMRIDRINSERAFATFDFTPIPIGRYTVEMTDLASSKTTSLERALELSQLVISGKMEVDLFPISRAFRVGEAGIFTVNIHNVGYNDIETPVLTASSSSSSSLYRLDSDPGQIPRRSILFLPMVKGEPGYVIPPKTTRTFAFRATPDEDYLGNDRIVIAKAPDSELDRFLEEFAIARKPTNMAGDVWNIVYNNFLSCVGETAVSFAENLRESGSILNKYGTLSYNVHDIVTNMLLIADGRVTNANILRLVDVMDDETVDYVPLKVERVYPSSVSARRTRGLFGFGWTVPWLDIHLQIINDSLVLINERKENVFLLNSEGDYTSAGLPDIVIKQIEGRYEFKYETIVFSFETTTGYLLEISDLGNENMITIEETDGKPTKLTHSSGSYITLEHSASGVSHITLINQNGITQTEAKYFYDSNGFLVELIIGSQLVSYTYNENGDLIDVGYSNGDRQTLEYDSHFWLSGMQKRSPSGEILSHETFQRSCDGRVEVTEQTLKVTSTFQFGIGGKLLYEKPSVGLPLVYSASPRENSLKIFVGDEVFTEEIYDSESRMSTKLFANGDKIIVHYNEDGAMAKLEDGVVSICELTYENNFLQELEFADGSKKEFHYDNKDQMDDVTLEDSSHIEFDYDGEGRMIYKQTSRETFEYSYDSSQRLTEIKTSEGSTKMEYSSQGLPTLLMYPDGTTLTYGYNEHGQRTSISTNTNYMVSYHYDTRRRLSHMINNDGDEIVRFAYDEDGHLSQRLLGNGMYTNYTYDANSLRLLFVDNYDSSHSLISYFEYKYDDRGFRTAMITEDGTYVYRYDASGQLIHWEIPSGPTEDVIYDNRQNRLVTTMKNSDPESYFTNPINQYTEQGNFITFKYDKLGNMIERAEKRGQTTLTKQLAFDQEQHLTRYEDRDVRCEYKYNVFGAMTMKTCTDGATGSYIVDPFSVYGATVLTQTEDGVSKHVFHALQHGLVGMETDSGSFEYFLFDGDGSTTETADEVGEIAGTYKYEPFGSQLQGPSDGSNTYRFMGKYGTRTLGVSPGLFIMGARIYDSELGRFLSKDPLDFFGSPTNQYAYANNNPIAFHDPHGLLFFVPLATSVLKGALTSAAANAISQGIDIYTKGGTFSDFSFSKLGKAAVSGAVSGIAGPIISKLPISSRAQNAIGGFIGGFLGGATSNALDGKPNDFWSPFTNGLINGATSFIPKKWQTAVSMAISVFQSIDKKALLKKATDLVLPLIPDFDFCLKCAFPGLDPGSWFVPPWLNPDGWGGVLSWVQSLDPNDILGPPSHGDRKFVGPADNMEYKIRFENDGNATGPARKVIITAPLDLDLDIGSFRLGSFGFGDKVVDLSFVSPFDLRLVNDTDQSGAVVTFQAGLDSINDEAYWLLQTIDPVTGAPPEDRSIGFLPPNNGTTGQGFVTFLARNADDVEHLSKVDAVASIFFDDNPPIETPLIFRTVDTVPPVAKFNMNSTLISSGGLLVNVEGTDSGSGIKSYDVYKMGDTGQMEALLSDIQDSTFLLPVSPGVEHKLIVLAKDNVGNAQEMNLDNVEVIVFNVTCPENCSTNGYCKPDGICECEDGFTGQDCSEEDMDIDPPILDVSFDAGVENQTIIAHISARLVTSSQDIDLSITLRNITPGVLFDVGTTQGEDVVIHQQQFGDVEITPPNYFSGLLTFSAIATAIRNDTTVLRESFISIPVAAVADTPTLSVTAACFHPGMDVRIHVTSKLSDQDGSEVLSVISNGRILVTGDNMIPVPDNYTSYQFNVTAEATETSNGDTATTVYTVLAEECDGVTSNQPTSLTGEVTSESTLVTRQSDGTRTTNLNTGEIKTTSKQDIHVGTGTVPTTVVRTDTGTVPTQATVSLPGSVTAASSIPVTGTELPGHVTRTEITGHVTATEIPGNVTGDSSSRDILTVSSSMLTEDAHPTTGYTKDETSDPDSTTHAFTTQESDTTTSSTVNTDNTKTILVSVLSVVGVTLTVAAIAVSVKGFQASKAKAPQTKYVTTGYDNAPIRLPPTASLAAPVYSYTPGYLPQGANMYRIQ